MMMIMITIVSQSVRPAITTIITIITITAPTPTNGNKKDKRIPTISPKVMGNAAVFTEARKRWDRGE